MDINSLVDYLSELTIYKSISVNEFDFDSGISVLLNSPVIHTSSKLFIGTLLSFKKTYSDNLLVHGATYLICNDNSNNREINYSIEGINYFLINSSMEVLIRKMERGIASEFSPLKKDMPNLCLDFWNDIMNGKLINNEDISKRFHSLYYPVKKHIACILIRYDDNHMVDSTFEKIEKAIAAFFSETNYFFNGHEWIILYTQDTETTEKLDFSYESFHEMLLANSLRAAISYPCQLPEFLSMMYKTTTTAFSVGVRMNIKTMVKRVYTYSELNPYLLVHLCSQRYKSFFRSTNLIFLAHPDVVTLYYHDKDENDNLLEVLNSYLTSGGSITIASKNLYMHRNTVQNKVKRIKELLHLDIDNGNDRFLLLISCILIKYQEEYMNSYITDFF